MCLEGCGGVVAWQLVQVEEVTTLKVKAKIRKGPPPLCVGWRMEGGGGGGGEGDKEKDPLEVWPVLDRGMWEKFDTMKYCIKCKKY